MKWRHARRVLKVSGLTLSLILLLAIGATYFGTGRVMFDGWGFGVEWGELVVYWQPNEEHGLLPWGWNIEKGHEFLLKWRPPLVQTWPGGSFRFCYIPMWLCLILAAFPTAVLFWRDRRIPPGHCQRCGYDLTGNVSGVCSECGTAVPGPGSAEEEKA